MKKYFIIASLVLLAASCSKKQTQEQSAPVLGQPVASSSLPSKAPATTTPPVQKPPTHVTPPSAPLTLNAYNNAAEHFKILYLSYFNLYTGATVKANSTKGVNFSACVPYGLMPSMCFVLNNQPYQNTNLSSAAVAVSILKDKTNISDCAVFSTQELQGGHMGTPVQNNGMVFITAQTSDAGAGNYSETHFNRAFYGTICYEIDETARWTAAGNYSPPKAEFDTKDVWGKLDVLRNGFQFVK